MAGQKSAENKAVSWKFGNDNHECTRKARRVHAAQRRKTSLKYGEATGSDALMELTAHGRTQEK